MSEENEFPTNDGATTNWRPGSPVTPMGGGSRSSQGGPATSAAPPPGRPPRRHLPVFASALVVALAVGAGLGVGHLWWTPAPNVSTSFAGGSASNGSGSNGSGSNSTTDPFGSGSLPFGSGGETSPFTDPFGSGSGSSSSGSAIEGSGAPSDVSSIAAKVDPGLVDVNSTFTYQKASGEGTGIVLTSNGEVLTNNHVIDGATKITVTDIANGKTYDATVVGYDPTKDVALLQLKSASGLQTATLGDSSSLKVNEPVVAIGNAGGVGGTPSAAGGSITGLDQSLSASDELNGTDEDLTGMIAVNADVQPGDSGGPLVTADGKVVGMDTAGSAGLTFSTSGTSATAGYAIPIDTALSIVKEIKSGTTSTSVHVGATAFIGVLISTGADSGFGSGGSFANGQGSSNSSTSGDTIQSVVSGGAAASAGLTAGDTITSFAGKTLTSSTNLTDLLIPYHPGNKVELGWTDSSGQSHSATVVLGSGPAS